MIFYVIIIIHSTVLPTFLQNVLWLLSSMDEQYKKINVKWNIIECTKPPENTMNVLLTTHTIQTATFLTKQDVVNE